MNTVFGKPLVDGTQMLLDIDWPAPGAAAIRVGDYKLIRLPVSYGVDGPSVRSGYAAADGDVFDVVGSGSSGRQTPSG